MHKACLEDVFRTKNECPTCESKIALGYESCLVVPKMAQNRVTRKKKQVDAQANLEAELKRQAEQ